MEAEVPAAAQTATVQAAVPAAVQTATVEVAVLTIATKQAAMDTIHVVNTATMDALLIRSRHTSATLCGGCVVGCGQSRSKCGSLPPSARTMAARACSQTLAPQLNHKTC